MGLGRRGTWDGMFWILIWVLVARSSHLPGCLCSASTAEDNHTPHRFAILGRLCLDGQRSRQTRGARLRCALSGDPGPGPASRGVLAASQAQAKPGSVAQEQQKLLMPPGRVVCPPSLRFRL